MKSYITCIYLCLFCFSFSRHFLAISLFSFAFSLFFTRISFLVQYLPRIYLLDNKVRRAHPALLLEQTGQGYIPTRSKKTWLRARCLIKPSPHRLEVWQRRTRAGTKFPRDVPASSLSA